MPQKASKATKAMTDDVGSSSRHKVRDFYGLITCSVCQGYIIEATTITDCLHTFCRSCILKHLEKRNVCPTCSLKPVTVASLRPDRILQTLIYKLVPGLYHTECQRVAEFHGGALAGKLCAGRRRFSGLVGIPEGKISQDDDINHNITNRSDSDHSDGADFFHPEEPISLSMEYHPEAVASVSSQKSSIPPIRYLQCPAAVTVWHLQRFITTKFDLNPNTMIVEIIYEDEILPRDFSLMDVAYCYNWMRVAPMRFYYRIFMQTPEKSGTTDKNRNYMTKADEKKEVKAEKLNVERKGKEISSGGVVKTFLATTETKTRDEFEFVDETAVKCESPQYNSIARRGGAAANVPIRDNLPNVRIEKMKLEDGVKTVKLTMISPTNEAINAKSKKFKIESAQVNDFKRLRSNDSEFGDAKLPTIVPDTTSKSKAKNHAQSSAKPSVKEENTRHKKNPSAVSGKRKSVDDDSPDELSCSKSNTKKCYINRNKKSHEMENGTKQHPNLPTLKVDLTNLKTKITLPKADKSPPAPPRTEIEETSPNKYEYVKNIGLLPVSDLEARKAKPDVTIPPFKEKKRKKMKHSKEPSEKRPKLHAEMIPNEKEPIKLKLKFTNNKPVKNEKKTNGIGEVPKITIPLPMPERASSKDTVAEMRKVRHKSHSSVNTALNRTLSEQSMAISSLVRRMSVDIPQLPYLPQNQIKTPIRSPPKTPPQKPSSPPQMAKPSPPHSPKPNVQTNSKAPIQTKPPTSKAYPGLLSPKADRGSRFNLLMSPQTYNARPASFPSYPVPMPRPLPPPKTSTFTSTSTKPLVSVLKRSSSLDTCPVTAKQSRVEETQPRSQASVPPLNRTNSTPANPSPPKSPDKVPYYTSSMGATYTHENNVKKPLPMLLPPSSISVTKMSDVQVAAAFLINDKRPAVEIVRINSNTPAIDQQKTPNQKTTRPPPATIPLVKIKKSASQTLTTKTTPTSPVTTSSLSINNNKVPPLNIAAANAKEPPVCDNIGALDLSGKSSRSPSVEKSPTALSATESSQQGKPKVTESETKDIKVGTTKPCQLPIPKLNEISKVRPPNTTAVMRQQNPSVRSIPNPSALAFRNQVLPVPESKPAKTVGTSQSTSVTNSVANASSEKPKDGGEKAKVTFLSTTPDSVVSTKTPIVSHKQVTKVETSESSLWHLWEEKKKMSKYLYLSPAVKMIIKIGDICVEINVY